MAAGHALRGLVGQGMDGKKRQTGGQIELVGFADASAASGMIVAPKSCVALIYAWGPGGSGCAGTGSPGGGGGGGAVYKRVRLSARQSITYACGVRGVPVTDDGNVQPGNDTTDTTVTLPSGAVVTAGGGKKGNGGAPGVGGVASGGDLNRSGANGFGSGGTAAGFADLVPGLAGGAGGALGGNGSAGSAAGGGGGAGSGGMGSISGAGANGRVLIMLVRTV